MKIAELSVASYIDGLKGVVAQDAEKVICPEMSRPIYNPANHTVDLVEVPCKGLDCAGWRWLPNEKKGSLRGTCGRMRLDPLQGIEKE